MPPARLRRRVAAIKNGAVNRRPFGKSQTCVLSVASSKVTCMFDSTVEPLAVKTADLAELIEQNHAELVSAECRMLHLACA
jgi:hypothetical protein